MQMSQMGINALLKKYEGSRVKAYRCPANIWTIGYGHTSAAGAPEVVDGMIITQQQADDILRRDLVKFETAVSGMVSKQITQQQFDVLVDFAYNVGAGALKTSTLLRKVNAADFDAVPVELMKWIKGGGKVLPGLVRRRQAEIEWWTAPSPLLSHNRQQLAEQQNDHVQPDAPLQRTMAQSKQGNAAMLAAGLGGLGAAKEIVAKAQDASDTADRLVGLLGNTTFVIMLAIIGLGAAIWYWRKKNMDRDGV